MTKLILASLAAGALLLACGVPVARADTVCNTGEGFQTGTISGNVVVVPGYPCNLSATVTGNVIVQSGASLTLSAATVNGNVTVQSNASLTLENGSTVEGNISANQCFFVQIVGPNAVNGNVSIPNCTADSGFCPGSCPPEEEDSRLTRPTVTSPLTSTSIPTLGGNFVCQNNPASCSAVDVSISGNMTVDGNFRAFVNGNSVGGNVQVNNNVNSLGQSSQVENNHINGSLTCRGNTPPLTTSGNTARGGINCH